MYRTITSFDLPGVELHHTDNHVALSFESEREILSSAVLNGGSRRVRSILNQRVVDNFDGSKTAFLPPEETLQNYARNEQLPEPTAGMMTSALMEYFRASTAIHEETGHRVAVAVTAGLSNARAAGDIAEYRKLAEMPKENGTINIILGTTVSLTPAAQAEALMIITEAKTALLHELNEQSRISSLPATGTGTDSTAVFASLDSLSVPFCGKHTLLGEMIGGLVKETLRNALLR